MHANSKVLFSYTKMVLNVIQRCLHTDTTLTWYVHQTVWCMPENHHWSKLWGPLTRVVMLFQYYTVQPALLSLLGNHLYNLLIIYNHMSLPMWSSKNVCSQYRDGFATLR